jgi:two-component system NtrC family sensor kinase
MRTNLRLSSKLMLILAFVMGFCQLIMAGWFVWSASRDLTTQHYQHLQSLKVNIGRTIALDVWNFNEESLRLLLSPYQNDPAIKMIVVEDLAGQRIEVESERELLQLAPAWFQFQQNLFREPLLLPMNNVGTLVGKLELIEDTSYIYLQLLKVLKQQFFELLILLLMMAIGLFFAFDNLVLKPITKLRTALDQAIGSADGIVANPLTGLADEFEDIALSIAGLSSRLSDDIQLIKKTNKQLELANEQTEHTLQNLKNTQSALLQSEKQAALTSIVAGVAHEVNTPLGVIITGSSCMDEQLSVLEHEFQNNLLTKSRLSSHLATLRHASALIQNNGTRAADLIQNFKQLAQSQSDDAVRCFNLADYIDDVIQAASNQWPHLDIQLQGDKDVHICAVPGLFHQLVWVFLDNVSVHAYPEHGPGECVINLSRSEDHIQLSCRDFGQGIAAEVQAKVFDPFFTTRFGLGSCGLGLSIAYQIVTKNLKGRLEVTSAAGEGAHFLITLPVLPNGQSTWLIS